MAVIDARGRRAPRRGRDPGLGRRAAGHGAPVAPGDGAELLEIPAGTREPDEPPLVTARRELAEECGLAAATWEEGPRFYTAPGFSTELMHLFLATDLTRATGRRRRGRGARALVDDPGRRAGGNRRRPHPGREVDGAALRSGWHAGCLDRRLDDDPPNLTIPSCLAEEAGLRYVTDDVPGIRRRRAGKGFTLLRPRGKRITDARAHRLDQGASPSRRPGPTSGSARSGAGTSRPPAATRAAASSTATTRAGARCATRPSTTRLIAFARALPRIRRRIDATCAAAACRARRCWRPSCACWRRRSSASATTSTRARTAPTA